MFEVVEARIDNEPGEDYKLRWRVKCAVKQLEIMYVHGLDGVLTIRMRIANFATSENKVSPTSHFLCLSRSLARNNNSGTNQSATVAVPCATSPFPSSG